MKNSTSANHSKAISAHKSKRIKVKLDARTLIVLPSRRIFRMWKIRYPGARIIS